MIGHEQLKQIFDANSFPAPTGPYVAVFRNTALDMSRVEDNGWNTCDVICLVDNDSITPLVGRTYPCYKYQLTNAQGGEACNWIASGWYPKAWQKGIHIKWPALVQLQSFVFLRSLDAVIGNADDYVQSGVVWDDFHGWSPDSAGCVTVVGNMNDGMRSDGWAVAYDWLYSKHAGINDFGLVLLCHEDLEAPRAIRIGSQGDAVNSLQSTLGITADGDFFAQSLAAVRKYAAANGVSGVLDGVARVDMLDKLGVS